MSMYELTQVLWRRRLLVGLVAFGLFVAGTAGVLATRSTTYTATSRVVVDQPGLVVSSSGSDVANKLGALMPTFCALLQGDSEAAAIAEQAGTSVTEARAVGCVPEPSTLVVALTAKTGGAQLSQQLSLAAADELVSVVEHRYDTQSVANADRVSATVFEAAGRPGADTNPRLRMLGIVAVGAILVAAAFTLAAEPHRRDWYAGRSSAVLASVGASEH